MFEQKLIGNKFLPVENKYFTNNIRLLELMKNVIANYIEKYIKL